MCYKEQETMQVHIQMDDQQGIVIRVKIGTAFLRVLISIAIGLCGATSVPWLIHLGQAMGWL
jgi:hypothetical protein